MRYGRAIKGALLLAMASVGCRQDADKARDRAILDDRRPLFTEVTDQVGIDFVHQTGRAYSFFYPEIMGSGVAVLDYDNDGDLDIYLVNGAFHSDSAATGPPVRNRLYQRGANGTYRDVTEASGLGDRGYGMGCAVGDIDNDGDLDVYVTNYGPNSLYLNNADGTFANVSASAGVANDAWGSSACFLDYDRDGYLDLYVSNYLAYDPSRKCQDAAGEPDYCGPQEFDGTPDVLYRNNGDGTFTDVSEASQIGRIAGKGLGVWCADLNDDNLQDIFVANDGEANLLWINRGDGTFIDQAAQRGVAVNEAGRTEAGMGVAGGDVNGDGYLDLFMTHLWKESNTLYVNDGAGRFEDRTAVAGLAKSSVPLTGFGTALFDFDHDGDLDIITVNGRVFRDEPLPGTALGLYWNFYAEPNLLFENDGAGRFTDTSPRAGALCSVVEVSRGLVTADLDNDGDLDVIVTNGGGRGRVYRNVAPKRGRWLMVRVVDARLSRDAIGARVTVTAGSRSYRRDVTRTYSYLSSGDAVAHFGLGDVRRIDRITVRWPDGLVETFPGPKANRRITLIRGSSSDRR